LLAKQHNEFSENKNIQFPCFHVLQGSAEAIGEKMKQRLIAYFVSNIFTKNHQNQFMYNYRKTNV